MKTREREHLLARHAELMNRHGPDSPQVAQFEDRWHGESNLHGLMVLAHALKLALTHPPQEEPT